MNNYILFTKDTLKAAYKRNVKNKGMEKGFTKKMLIKKVDIALLYSLSYLDIIQHSTAVL